MKRSVEYANAFFDVTNSNY